MWGACCARFQELAKLCDPDDPKTDKASILAESIKIITQLKVEKGQLRQLNKFLEVGVGQPNFLLVRAPRLYVQVPAYSIKFDEGVLATSLKAASGSGVVVLWGGRLASP